MALIKSISGIRGTIGGKAGDGLSPLDIVKFVSAYSCFIRERKANHSNKIIVGRDARISGEMVRNVVTGTLMGMGFDVVDIGLATTPTTELAVIIGHAAGGIILTASHNPRNWNALKLLDEKGEFLSAEDGRKVLETAKSEHFRYAQADDLGTCISDDSYTRKHIDQVLALPLVDTEAIKKAGFSVAIDGINSVGGIAIPMLLEALGVKKIAKLNCDPTGKFAHNPEPLPAHLEDICKLVKEAKADVGFVVDPDVDRLAIVCEDGSMFGEEYTLVSVADYVLRNTPGNTVSNLSSTRALKILTEKFGENYSASAVGEVNVVEKMKETNAVIGGEGNGGVIYPQCHYGRDALVGIALYLSYLAKRKIKPSVLKKEYPVLYMTKQRFDLQPGMNVDEILSNIKKKYSSYPVNDIDGVKIDFPEGWVHFRKSNTEPIIRIYAEAVTEEQAENLASDILKNI